LGVDFSFANFLLNILFLNNDGFVDGDDDDEDGVVFGDDDDDDDNDFDFANNMLFDVLI